MYGHVLAAFRYGREDLGKNLLIFGLASFMVNFFSLNFGYPHLFSLGSYLVTSRNNFKTRNGPSCKSQDKFAFDQNGRI